MIITKTRLAAALASGAILLNTLASSAFAATSLELSGNGSSSENKVSVSKDVNTTVVQNNEAKVTNNVTSKSSTGGNKANDNTGGDVTIGTGNAKSRVDLSTKVNLNKAEVSNCNCEGDVEVKVAGNGSDSENKVKLESGSNSSVFQNNNADIDNRVDTKTNTGKNNANRNTGGDTSIVTGHTQTDVRIDNKANANIARVGSNHGGHQGKVSAIVHGNGSYSDNKVDLSANRSVDLVQDNDAYIDNSVHTKTNTGKNQAKDNTGGGVLVDTGNATARTQVGNVANFNSADVDCGCETDVLAKVGGNGSYSDNKIKTNFDQDHRIFADNYADLQNDLDTSAKTGKNTVNRNTAEESDPAVITGHSEEDQRVNNIANANLFGSGENGIEFDFDLGSIFGYSHH